MIRFEAIIEQFGQQGEKTGWSYIRVPAKQATKLHSSDRKSFRVKGKLDAHAIGGVNLIPMGGGDYILAVNSGMRRALAKGKGARVKVVLENDLEEVTVPAALLECLEDEPSARDAFQKLTRSHRNYFINWIRSARTEETTARRIAATINALVRGWNFGEMMRQQKKERSA